MTAQGATSLGSGQQDPSFSHTPCPSKWPAAHSPASWPCLIYMETLTADPTLGLLQGDGWGLSGGSALKLRNETLTSYLAQPWGVNMPPGPKFTLCRPLWTQSGPALRDDWLPASRPRASGVPA